MTRQGEVLRMGRLRRRAAEMGTDVPHIVKNDAAAERDDHHGDGDDKGTTNEKESSRDSSR